MIIIRDTREKKGYWDLSFAVGIDSMEVGTVYPGDYTIKGLEDVVAIERKRTTGEIATNLGKKSKQFLAELEAMRDFRFAYILCEFSLEDVNVFPENSGIPKKLWSRLRMSPKFLLSRISALSEQYGVEFIFCGSKFGAEEKAIIIFEQVQSIIGGEQ